MGGYSSVEATIELLRTALKEGPFGRFVLLQGLDYPIKTNTEINDFFEEYSEKEFIKAQDISHSQNYHEIHKYRFFWALDDHSRFGKTVNKINLFLLRKKWILPIRRNYTSSTDGRKLFVYQGAAQFGITRGAAEYIVDFHDKNLRFNAYFKYVYAPDEAYFHTIIYNSGFVKNTVDGKAVNRNNITELENLTYFEYPDKVVLFTKKDDWKKLKDTGFLYFRKASSESKELLDYIDSVHEKET